MEKNRTLVKLVHYRPIMCAFLALLFGVVAGRKLFMGDTLYIVTVSLAFVAFGLACLFYRKWIPFILAIICFFAGTGMFFAEDAIFKGKEYNEPQTVIARVTDNISESDYYYRIVLDECIINGEDGKGISLSVYKNDTTKIKVGDIISFTAYLNNADLYSLGQFNLFYFRNNTAYVAKTNVSDLNIVSGYLKLDEKVRESIKELLLNNMSEESAYLAFAMLTGDRSNLDETIYEDFKGAGVIHILAVSGLHISVLMGVISWLLKKMKVNKYANLLIIFAVLLLYCYICGWTPSVIRASIMALTFIITQLVAEEYDPLNAWSIAGIILLFINPFNGLDMGFWMSFSSVVCIFMICPPLTKLLKKVFPKYFAEAFAVSISASLGIAPFLIAMQQKLNLLSVFANIIILPFFEVVFILLFAFVILSAIPYVGIILKLPDWGLQGIDAIAKFFAGTNAIIETRDIDILECVLFYLAIFGVSYFFMASKKVKALCLAIIACIFSIYSVTKTFIKSNLGSSVSCITVYGETNYILSNAQGELLFVGNSFTNSDEKYLLNNRIKDIDYFLAVDIDEGEANLFFSGAKTFNSKELVSYQEFTGSSKESIVDVNVKNIIGDYIFEYVYSNEKYLGTKIYFDNKSIFFASNGKLSYNDYEYIERYISIEKFDGVYLGGKTMLAENFCLSAAVFASYTGQYVNFSINRDGNMIYDLKNNAVRSLD